MDLTILSIYFVDGCSERIKECSYGILSGTETMIMGDIIIRPKDTRIRLSEDDMVPEILPLARSRKLNILQDREGESKPICIIKCRKKNFV